MTRLSYDTDVSDEQWGLLEPLLPSAKPGGRPRSVDLREIVNAICYVLRAGCAWRLLPHDFPKWQTVYYYLRQWEKAGVWERANAALRVQIREQAGRNAQPSAGIIDSQSRQREQLKK